MAIKFYDIISSFLPQGKAWELQSNTKKLLNGSSEEFNREYETSKDFYNNFNIIQSDKLAYNHGIDYLIKTEIFTNAEIQRIIVEYLNKDYEYNTIIEDFASFIGESISFVSLPTSLEFGEMNVGDEFGDPSLNRYMEILIKFSETISCQNYKKIEWLALFLKPPYVNVIFENKPLNSITPFTLGYAQFGDELGELQSC